MKQPDSKIPEGFEKVTEGNVKKGDRASVMFGDEQVEGDASGLAGAPVIPLRVIGVTVYRKKAELNGAATTPAAAPKSEKVGGPNDGAEMPETEVRTPAPKKETAPADRPRTGDDKILLAKVPMGLLVSIAMAQDFQSERFGPKHSFRKENVVTDQLSQAIGHIFAYMDGEDHETRSGVHHLGHAAMRLGYVMQNMADGTLVDDRYKHGS